MPRIYNKSSERSKRRQLRKQMPKAEAAIWPRLRGGQILGRRFRRQYSVGPYVIDFYCPSLKMAVEIDGDSHFNEEAQGYDQVREAFIGSFGIKFIRFTNEEVYRNLDGVFESIVEFAQKRAKESGSPPPY